MTSKGQKTCSDTGSAGVSDPMRIRAHHLLCMQGFQGYGYSKDFALHMLKVMDHIMDNPLCELDIITECDEICLHCPHKVGEIVIRGPMLMRTSKKWILRFLKNLECWKVQK